jgi:UDP:flavonoid glycosyltransferase YjiC (YdhE family)
MSEAERRLRVLLVAEAVTLAHVARAFAMASVLDPARFDVHVAWDPRYNALFGALRWPFHPITTMPGELFLRRLARGAPMHDRDTLEGYVEEDLAVLNNVRPDIVVGDFRLSLPVSARLAAVPLLTVANAYWSPNGGQTFLFDEYDYPLSRVVGQAASRALFRLFSRVGFAAHTRPLNALLREHRLPSVGGDIRRMYTEGDWTAYTDIPALGPPTLPARHRFIGAALWSPELPLPEWWRSLPREPKVVYVNLGSSGEAAVLPVVLEGLAGLDVSVIVATAGRAQIATPPGNAFVADFLPGATATERAALVICNGGSPAAYQALAAGVPVLAVSGNNMDQHLNMARVRKSGAGELLKAAGLRAQDLRNVATSMLDSPSYTEASRQLASSHRANRVAELFPVLLNEIAARR